MKKLLNILSRQRLTDTAFQAIDIYREKNSNTDGNTLAIIAVYNFGKIQGIRQERKRRATK